MSPREMAMAARVERLEERVKRLEADRKQALTLATLTGVDYGVRAAERGWNLQTALTEAERLLA